MERIIEINDSVYTFNELELRVSKERCVWELVSDSAEHPEQLLPPELKAFLEYMKEVKVFSGGNTELTEGFNASSGSTIEPKRLKQLMNCSKEALRELGLTFRGYRSNGQRLVEGRLYAEVSVIQINDLLSDDSFAAKLPPDFEKEPPATLSAKTQA